MEKELYNKSEIKRREWYINICRDKRIPKKIQEESFSVGFILAEHKELTKRLNKKHSKLNKYIEQLAFLKTATGKDYDKHGEEYENKILTIEEVHKVILNDELVTSYVEKRLGIKTAYNLMAEFKNKG